MTPELIGVWIVHWTPTNHFGQAPIQISESFGVGFLINAPQNSSTYMIWAFGLTNVLIKGVWISEGSPNWPRACMLAGCQITVCVIEGLH